MRKLIGGIVSLVLAATVLTGGVLLPAPADARVFVGVGVGVGPYWGWPYAYNPYPYPYPYYYPAPPVVYAPPVAYVPPPAPAPTVVAPQAQSWYFCDNPRGYYPYVGSCTSGWRQVPAQPH
ncbi:MAG TPA: hypothetical protein VL993_01420 [Stellaceae bacterium]|nr:hypothetical protein [Stellaceae bacterium]